MGRIDFDFTIRKIFLDEKVIAMIEFKKELTH